MATYGDSASEYPYKPLQKKRKQKYSMLTRVINFANLPVTRSYVNNERFSTTAWAAADVLEAIRIRSGCTVMGVQMELLTKSVDKKDIISIGYGTDADRWGTYNLSNDTGMKDYPKAHGNLTDGEQFVLFGEPVYFSAADSVDITIDRAAIEGKIRLIVHLLEDDR